MADPDVVASFSKWRDVDISSKQLQLATSRKIAKAIWFPEWDLFMMQHVQDYIRGVHICVLHAIRQWSTD